MKKNSAKKSNRRKEAEERQAYYDQLTTEQKIELAKSRRGNSAREIARLEKELGR